MRKVLNSPPAREWYILFFLLGGNIWLSSYDSGFIKVIIGTLWLGVACLAYSGLKK